MSKTIKTQKIFKIDFFGREEPDSTAEERDPWLYAEYEYDQRGNLVCETSYTPAGEIEQVASYTYDEKDKLASEKFVQEGDDFSEWREYFRNEEGKMQQEVHHFLDGTQDVVGYHYSDDGNLASKTYANDDGETEREEEFVYEDGKLIQEKTLSFDGDVLATHAYSYHPNGFIKEHSLRVPEDHGELKHLSFYDESGNKIKVLVYNALGHLVEITRMSYNDNNVLLKIEEENQHKNTVIEYEMDEHNNPLKQVEKDAEGKVISSITRSYDEEGRVLESVVLIEGANPQATQDYKLQYEYEFYTE
jgi:hypothetical protein